MKHLRLVRHETRGRVTYKWDVLSAQSGAYLGMIAWWNGWRRYCFFPSERTVFEQDCLRDIAQFIEEQTAERKAAVAAIRACRQEGHEFTGDPLACSKCLAPYVKSRAEHYP